MTERCRWVKHKQCPDGRCWLPGCMGGAVYGKHGCTCPPLCNKETEFKRLSEKIEELEALVVELKQERQEVQRGEET